jgi:hypothetical protein
MAVWDPRFLRRPSAVAEKRFGVGQAGITPLFLCNWLARPLRGTVALEGLFRQSLDLLAVTVCLLMCSGFGSRFDDGAIPFASGSGARLSVGRNGKQIVWLMWDFISERPRADPKPRAFAARQG